MKLRPALEIILFVVCIAASRVCASAGDIPAPGEPGALRGTASPKLFINGVEFLPDLDIRMRGSIAFIPLNDDLEIALDAIMTQDLMSIATSIEFRTSDAVLVFDEGKTLFLSGGMERELPGPPFSANGYLYVPALDFFQLLGYGVEVSGNIISVSKSILPLDIMEGIPPEFLISEPGEKEPAPEKKEAPRGIQYTFDNTTEFENVAVSGDTVQSSLTPKTEYYNKFNLRVDGNVAGGYKLSSVLRTQGTTERLLNEGEISRFNAVLAKGTHSFQLYDLSPKYARFALKNYQMQGVQFQKGLESAQLTALWGKTPKRLKESRYNRYVEGIVADFILGKAKLSASAVRLKDTGIPQEAPRLDNRVYNANGFLEVGGIKLGTEFSLSETRRYSASPAYGKAVWHEASFKNKTSGVNTSYERTGSGFVSETAFFTPGRRETLVTANHRIGKNYTLGGGYKNVRMLGESTSIIPLQASLTPFAGRPKMRFKLQGHFEETRGRSGPRMTDKRKVDVSDRVGKAKVDFGFERKKQKDSFAEWNFRTSRKYRYITPITKKTQIILQRKDERKTNSSKPIKRYTQAKFIIETEEWAELSVNIERYYNNTSNDRTNMGVSYRKLDIYNDREYGFEYTFQNYSAHNDNSIMFSYSITR